MKKLCFVMVFALVLSSTAFAFATSAKTEDTKSVSNQKESTKVTETAKDAKDKAKDAKEEAKDLAKDAKDQAKDLVKDAKDQAKDIVKDAKDQAKKLSLSEKKELILKKYSSDELSALTKAGEAIKKADSKVKVLEVNSIVSDTKNFKFDTPPVIKGNRTLIPVRAITEGLGAKVDYDNATKKVTITKDGTTIELTLGNNIALVNGKEVKLDTKADTMNSRTYVPMRFIMETFKMKVTYDKDGTIQVEESADETTTNSAIQTTDSAIQTTNAAIQTTSSAVQTTSSAIQ